MDRRIIVLARPAAPTGTAGADADVVQPGQLARVYPGHVIAFLTEILQQHGQAPRLSLAGSGNDPATIYMPSSRFSVAQILAVIGNVPRGCGGIAFQVGLRFHVSACGVYGYALLSSPDRDSLVGVVQRYNGLVDPLVMLHYVGTARQPMWGLTPVLACAPTDALYQFAMEMKLASMLTVMRDLYGEAFRFRRIRLRYPAPANAADYRRIFACEIEFDCAANDVSFGRLAATAKRASDPITHAMMLELCEQSFQQINSGTSVSGLVLTILMERHGAFPNIEQTARALQLSCRTLRRRLDAEGTSFSKILLRHRMQLALSYLRTSELSNEEIAGRLGYSDAHNFRRAFLSWAGTAPAHFRQLGRARRGGGGRPAPEPAPLPGPAGLGAG
jgi:AraC-like DNA-binding protein